MLTSNYRIREIVTQQQGRHGTDVRHGFTWHCSPEADTVGFPWGKGRVGAGAGGKQLIYLLSVYGNSWGCFLHCHSKTRGNSFFTKKIGLSLTGGKVHGHTYSCAFIHTCIMGSYTDTVYRLTNRRKKTLFVKLLHRIMKHLWSIYNELWLHITQEKEIYKDLWQHFTSEKGTTWERKKNIITQAKYLKHFQWNLHQ